MLETNINNFSEGKTFNVDLKIETKGDYIIEDIKNNAIRVIYFQFKSLKGHAKQIERKVELCTEGG